MTLAGTFSQAVRLNAGGLKGPMVLVLQAK